jgi:ArsR family transcriptional regulator
VSPHDLGAKRELTIFGYLAKMPNSMDRKTRARFEARANIIKAMGHPTRLFIVEELSRAEQSVSELTEMIGADVSTVSKHLAILRNVGIVDDEKRGVQVFYSLRCPCVLSFFSCVENVIKTTAERHKELVE